MKIASVFLFVLLPMPLISAAESSKEAIFPPSLSGKPSVELGEFIRSSMLEKGERLGWDWRVNSDIDWQDGITQVNSTGYSHRDGVARINVMGVRSSVLKKRKDELGWEVSLRTMKPAKFGPEAIELSPLDCFGTLYDGCSFDPASSLKAAGIATKKICSVHLNGSNFSDTYLISHSGKEDMLMTWANSGGSGGESSRVTLRQNSKDAEAEACEKNK